jgi:hypothetical protein
MTNEREKTMTQPRERAVPCAVCYADTWNNSGLCERHDALLGQVISSFEKDLRAEAAAGRKFLDRQCGEV